MRYPVCMLYLPTDESAITVNIISGCGGLPERSSSISTPIFHFFSTEIYVRNFAEGKLRFEHYQPSGTRMINFHP